MAEITTHNEWELEGGKRVPAASIPQNEELSTRAGVVANVIRLEAKTLLSAAFLLLGTADAQSRGRVEAHSPQVNFFTTLPAKTEIL